MKPRIAAVVGLAALSLTGALLAASKTGPADPLGVLGAPGAVLADALKSAQREDLEITLMVGHTNFKGKVVGVTSGLVALRYVWRDQREITAYIPKDRIDAALVESPAAAPPAVK